MQWVCYMGLFGINEHIHIYNEVIRLTCAIGLLGKYEITLVG